ncbi:MAG: type II secretion system F family protein [Bacilli bacterium]|jgi:tight adherence protein C|nr:type II secretion system F family protein [Bacilli bacterium]
MKQTIANKIYRKKTIDKINSKIKLLGLNQMLDAVQFLNIRLIIMIVMFILIFIFSKIGYILAPIVSVVFYYLMEYLILDYQAKIRGKALEKEALFFFEVFVLTLESGRNLRQALILTTENVDSEISNEFKKTLAEVKLGKSLNEALESMKKRIPSDTINNTILNMIQSNTFGNSMVDSIYNQIEYLRNKQMLDVRAEIAKLPTKVSVISVLFFVPIMLLIILAPVIIQYITK